MSTAPHIPMTKVVKHMLDYLRILAVVSLILWPLVVVVMTVGQYSHPETWGVDIGVFSRFIIDLSAFDGGVTESAGVRDSLISGKAILNIDTSSLQALYLFTAVTELGGIVGLYILLQLRALFASLAGGVLFAAENSGRLKKIGLAVLAWTLFNPLLQYFGGQAMLTEYSLNVPGIQLSPAFNINGLGILIGLSMIVFAGVLKEAASMHEFQQLTI